jgi:hypothetical protein
MIDSLKPGQKVRCTIDAVPRSKGGRDTIARLMRLDKDVAKGLRRAQAHRKRTMNVYVRGGRDWHSRIRAGKNLRVTPGESWTFAFVPQIRADLESVQECISIEKA